MAEILTAISTNTESTKNSGNAVHYALVRTINRIEANTGLRSLASTILGKFLTHKENNYKYIALDTLRDVAKFDISNVSKHKNTILSCLQDADISIKRRSLDLVYLIVNENNIKDIVKELLNFLVLATDDLIEEVTTNLSSLLEKYSPSLKFQVDSLIKMLCLSGSHVNEATLSSIINLVVSNNSISLYATEKIFHAISNNKGMEGLVKVGLYLIGEFGLQVTSSDSSERFSESQLVNLLTDLDTKRFSDRGVREHLLNAIAKLYGNVQNNLKGELDEIIEKNSKCFDSEIQERAVEYRVLNLRMNNVIQSEVLKNIPQPLGLEATNKFFFKKGIASCRFRRGDYNSASQD